MHVPALIYDLAIVLGTASITTLLFKKIRQPVVLGYLIAGFIVGPYSAPIPLVTDVPNIKILAELGVIFLMFSLGLEFTFHKLVRIGKRATGIALFQVACMVLLGYLTGLFLGWNHVDSLFLGAAISISSTTIILKAFEELNLKTRRFTEIVLGVLIVEDLIAVLLLVILSTFVVNWTLAPVLFTTLKLIAFVGGWFVAGYFLIPRFLKYAAKFTDNETLTILAVGLCLFLVVVSAQFQYSPALGAFMMGSILAETSEGRRIEELVRPLRDLFASIFFVSVGMLIDPSVIAEHQKIIIVVTSVVILGTVVTTTLGAIVVGQTIKRAVQIGFSLGQIGEFSFIIASLGESTKLTGPLLYPTIVGVSVITCFATPYLIRLADPLARFLDRRLPRRVTQYSYWVANPKKRNGILQSLFQYLLKGSSSAHEKQLTSFAPWDLHLVKLTVKPTSVMIGQRLDEIDVRRKFNLNIVVIRRGNRVIPSPKAADRLLPHDELLILAIDEKIAAFKATLETESDSSMALHELSDYRLKDVYIDEKSILIGQTIQSAKFGDNLKGLVVGFERKSTRTINPEPGTLLEVGDLLWVLTTS